MSVAIVTLLCGTLLFYVVLNVRALLGHLDFSLGYSAFVTLFFVYLNYCYNFFIYLIFNDIYRENFKSLFCRCCSRCSRNTLADLRERNRVLPVEGAEKGVATVIQIRFRNLQST